MKLNEKNEIVLTVSEAKAIERIVTAAMMATSESDVISTDIKGVGYELSEQIKNSEQCADRRKPLRDLSKEWLKNQETWVLKQLVTEWVRLDVESENMYLMDHDIDEVEADTAWLGSLKIPENPSFSWAKRIYERNDENDDSFLWREYGGIDPVWDIYFSDGELNMIVQELKDRDEYGKPGIKTQKGLIK